MSNGPELPPGWCWTTLSECVQRSEYGTSVKCDATANGVPVLRIPNIARGEIDLDDLKFSTSPLTLSADARLQPGDMLMCRTNGSVSLIGKTALVRHEFDRPFAFASYLLRFRFKDQSLASWINLFVRSPEGRFFIERNAASSAGQHNVSLSLIHSMRLPLAPLNEQRRIVAKIEELFSDLDAGVAALERAKANLKRYRAAVLKAAVEGELTKAWRAEHPNTEPAAKLLARILTERRKKWEAEQLANFAALGKEPPRKWKDKYVEPAPPDTSGLPELPHTWCWATLSQIGILDRGRSRHRPRNAPHLYGGPYPFVQTGDIRHADTFVREYCQTYSEAGRKQSKLWTAGTLCITIAANIAETAILGFDACFPDSVVGFIPETDGVSVRFVEFFLRTIQQHLEAYAPATAQKNINLATLSGVAIPFPPTAEQELIVSETDSRLSIVTVSESEIRRSESRAARLRQSILKDAFNGRLAR